MSFFLGLLGLPDFLKPEYQGLCWLLDDLNATCLVIDGGKLGSTELTFPKEFTSSSHGQTSDERKPKKQEIPWKCLNVFRGDLWVADSVDPHRSPLDTFRHFQGISYFFGFLSSEVCPCELRVKSSGHVSSVEPSLPPSKTRQVAFKSFNDQHSPWYSDGTWLSL